MAGMGAGASRRAEGEGSGDECVPPLGLIIPGFANNPTK